ncbi:GNAT family N-acetyltransferase [uncultured Polaribacter sp.]|uniref:GNAT family N-acetyltransferase n=1 Tax=uncultured Polaribacter sp. TaxID=174711 RepID=UPI00262B078C|nr:GNAT family N-acetyltransferase [uncultured Polaribacter sp.]
MSFNFTKFPVLKTERLILREITFNDVDVIFNLRSSKEINKFIGTKRVQNNKEAKDFIIKCDELYKVKNRILWGIEYQQKIIGTIVLHNISLEKKYGEIGYKLKPEFQKKGFMSEVFKVILKFAFKELTLKTVEAYTHKNNSSSIALLEKHNFVFQEERKCNTFDFNRIFKLEI